MNHVIEGGTKELIDKTSKTVSRRVVLAAEEYTSGQLADKIEVPKLNVGLVMALPQTNGFLIIINN